MSERMHYRMVASEKFTLADIALFVRRAVDSGFSLSDRVILDWDMDEARERITVEQR